MNKNIPKKIWLLIDEHEDCIGIERNWYPQRMPNKNNFEYILKTGRKTMKFFKKKSKEVKGSAQFIQAETSDLFVESIVKLNESFIEIIKNRTVAIETYDKIIEFLIDREKMRNLPEILNMDDLEKKQW